MDIQRFLLFLFAQADSMPLLEAVEFGRLFGKSAASVRGCVSRLKRAGLLSQVQSGRNSARYGLSSTGKTVAYGITHKFMDIHSMVEQRDSWDGNWTIVSFEIPEKTREKRDRFREALKQVGFGQLASGVWIAPRDKSETVVSLADSLHIDSKIILSISKDVRFGGKPVASLAEKIWPLARLNRDYSIMNRKMESRLKQLRKALETNHPPDAREAFLGIFIVFSEAADLISRDPCLPEQLLPENWLGLRAQDLIHEYFHLLHGLELNDPYAYLLKLPAGLSIPAPKVKPRRNTR